MKRTEDELQGLIASNRYKATDLTGKEWTLRLLDLSDRVEFEREFGADNPNTGAATGARFVLWLAIRRNGCDQAQLDRGEYALTLDECGRRFTMLQMKRLDSVLLALLVGSGWTSDTEADDGLGPTLGGEGVLAPASVSSGTVSQPSSAATQE